MCITRRRSFDKPRSRLHMTITVGGKKPISTICYRHVTFYILAYVYMYIGSAKLHFHVFFVNAQKTLYMHTWHDLRFEKISSSFILCAVFLFYALQRFDIFQVISSMVGYLYQDNMSVNTP